MNQIPVPATGGVNLLMDPRRIRDDELCYAKNLVPTKPGLLSKRGVAAFAFSGPDPVLNGDGTFRFPSAFVFGNLPLFDFGYCLTSPSVGSTVLSAGSIGNVDGLGFTEIAYVNDARPWLIPFNNKLYCFPNHVPGDDHPEVGKVVQTAVDGSLEIADFNWSASQVTLRSPRVATPYKGRMAYANFGPGYENVVTFSDADDPALVHEDFLASNGKHIRLPVPATDGVVAMVEIAQTSIGTPMESALLVLCQFSAFIITGEMLQTTEVPAGSSYSGSMKVNQVNEPCGCASAQTLVRTQYGVVWTGPDDVWMMNVGSIPVRVGSKIRPVIERCPPDKRYLMHAEYHGGFYRVAVCGDGQVPAVHDRMGEQWWLDLRFGVPADWSQAQWWGPQVYVIPGAANTAPLPGTYIMARDQRPGRTNKLYTLTVGLTDDFVNNGTASTVLSFSELDVDGAYDSAYDPSNDSGNGSAETWEDGNEVMFELRTKEYDYAAFEQPAPTFDKLWLGCDVDITANELVQLQTEIIIGDSYDEQAVQVDQKGFVLGVDSLDDARMYRKVIGVHVPRDPDTPLVGKTYQLVLRDVAGWPVPKDGLGNYFVATDGGGLGAEFFLLTLEDGFYEDIGAFLDQLVTQMSTLASGGAVSHNQNTSPRPKVIISYSSTGSVWGYDVDAPQYVEGDAARSTRAIAAKLGFTDTDQTTTSAPDDTHTAGEYVRGKLCAALSIGGIVLRVEPSGRSPS